MVGHDEHQRARFKERWASSACVASTAPIVIPNSLRCVHPTHRRSSMGNPGAPPPALLRGRSTSTVRTRAQHPGPFGRAGGHDQMLARSWRARKAGICSRRTARHRGTPRESSARMRSASPQPGRSSGSTRARLPLAKTRVVGNVLCSILRCGPLSNAGKECGCSPSRCDGIIAEFVRPGVKTSGHRSPKYRNNGKSRRARAI